MTASISRRRLLFACAYVAIVALTFAVQREIRPFVRAGGLQDFGVLDWAPSFLVAFASPVLMAAIDPRLEGLARFSLGLFIMQFIQEVEQMPPAHRYDSADVADVAAIVAGFVLSYLLLRWIGPVPPPMQVGSYTLDIGKG
jgi:hypothetical protein